MEEKKLNATQRWRRRMYESELCMNCGGFNLRHPLQNCQECQDGISLQQKSRRRELKYKVLAAYGTVCACCQESEPMFLGLDHINNDGSKELKSGYHFYEKLRKEGYPQGSYRVLCHNCNLGRYLNGGICPHAEG